MILSAEIMVIALDEVADQAFVPRLIILIVVALALTAVVYGVVAVVVKMDDVGLTSLRPHPNRAEGRPGPGRRDARTALNALSGRDGGDARVGGHILLAGSDHLGWHTPYGLVHHVEDQVHHGVESAGGVLAWLVNTGASAVIGWSSEP